jgi:putative endonuclease
MYEHKRKLRPGFTAKYNVDRLVYFERTEDVEAAISRERSIKGWLRRRKVALIESTNPAWEDLSAEWFDDTVAAAPAEQDPSHSLRMTSGSASLG